MELFIKKHFRIWWLQIGFTIIMSGFLSLLYVFFVKSHLNLGYIILAEALGSLASVFCILLRNKVSCQRDIRLGFLLVFVSLFLLLLPIAPLVLVIPYTIFKVTGIIMFFIPYNILFFKNSNSHKKLSRMTSYWSIGLLVGIIAPLLGGFIFSHFGLPFFMLAAVMLLCCTFILTFFVKKDVYLYGVKEIFTHIRSFRTIVMIDGALTTASNILLTLYLLTFVRGAFDFGLLLSFIALVSVSFSFLLAKISDRHKKRLEFIWPLSTFSGFIMILFYFSHSFWSAVVLVILFKFVSTILNPIQSNIVFDRPKTTAITWISRELFLNIGRVVFLLLLAFLAFFGFLKESFIVLGLLFIVFPFIVYKKGVYKKYK